MLDQGEVSGITETVQGIVAARLDALADSETQLLQAAAVVGKVFWPGAVEALAIRVARSIDADRTARVLDQIVSERGSGPELVRMDNGPEMTANALRDWCRFSRAGRSFIEPGSLWQNPFVESFGSPRPRTRPSPSRPSTPCSRRKRSSMTGGRTSTTTGDRTAASAGNPQPPTPLP